MGCGATTTTLRLKGVNGEPYTEAANHWAWEFIRIGEEPHDVERKQGGRDILYPLFNAITKVDADYETDKE